LLLAAGTASAQVAIPIHESGDGASVSAAVASDSGSNGLSTFSSSNDGVDPGGGLAAPAPGKGEGGGQYDNKAREGGDWKSRLAFEAAGGFNIPNNSTSPYVNLGGQFTTGGGYHLTRAVSVLAEYQFIYDGLPDKIVAEAGANGGNVRLWSLTLAPVINLMPKKATSVFVTGGGGFYRKVTSFTDPQQVLYCQYFCEVGVQNVVIGHFSSNQGGWNVGGGVSHRFGGMYGDGRMEVFAEARYLDVMTPAVTTQPNGLGLTSIGADTKLVPVSFGVRF
jgi:hypothetical protein